MPKTKRYPNLVKACAAKRVRREAASDQKLLNHEIPQDAQINVEITGSGITTRVRGTYFGVGVILGRLFGFRAGDK